MAGDDVRDVEPGTMPLNLIPCGVALGEQPHEVVYGAPAIDLGGHSRGPGSLQV